MYRQDTYQQGRTFQQDADQLMQDVQDAKPSRSFAEVVDFCKRMGLPGEIVGKWVWISFTQKPGPETIKALKDFGFHWSQRRQAWAHNCGHECRPGNGNPWDKYEHYPIEPDSREDRKRNFYRSDGRYSS